MKVLWGIPLCYDCKVTGLIGKLERRHSLKRDRSRGQKCLCKVWNPVKMKVQKRPPKAFSLFLWNINNAAIKYNSPWTSISAWQKPLSGWSYFFCAVWGTIDLSACRDLVRCNLLEPFLFSFYIIVINISSVVTLRYFFPLVLKESQSLKITQENVDM